MQHIVWLKIFKLNRCKSAKFIFSLTSSISCPISNNSARKLHTERNQKFKHHFGCFYFWFWVERFVHLQRMLQKVRNQVDLRSNAHANRYGLRAVSAKPTERIREYTIRKIIKTEFLSPRVFIDFSCCVSRHTAAPTKIDNRSFQSSFLLDF